MKAKDTEQAINKIKWRQHEMILVTALTLMKVVSYVWDSLHFSQEEINMRYANVFKETHVPFSLYRNVIVPDTTVILCAYLIYLLFNFYFIPRFSTSQLLR